MASGQGSAVGVRGAEGAGKKDGEEFAGRGRLTVEIRGTAPVVTTAPINGVSLFVGVVWKRRDSRPTRRDEARVL